jgi:2-polyprenyl-3-methyl-5-hydroxy-6-metoxy-1,4-benzoquinol methylase
MISIHDCPACNATQLTPYITCVDHSVSHETFNIVKCPQCELLLTNPRPEQAQIGKYYQSPAYTSHIGTAKNTLDRIYLGARNITLKWKLSLLKKHTHLTTQKSILDVGCGTGEFLKVAKLQGWKTAGVEPSSHARQQAHASISMDIKSSFSEISNRDAKFDAITLWHVLEHIDDLNTTIEILKNLLTENGTIFIAVPNHNSWDAAHYKTYWAAYDVPRHLWHFNKKSMTIILGNHKLTISKIIPMWLDAFYVSLLSEKYRNKGRLTLKCATQAFINGFRSNYNAALNKEYSSLIYVVKK